MTFDSSQKRPRILTIIFAFMVALSGLFLFFAQVYAMEPPVITAVTPNQAERGATGVVLRLEISEMPPETVTSVAIGMEEGTDIDYDPAGLVTATFDFPGDMPLEAFTVTVMFDGPMGDIVAKSNSDGLFTIVEAGAQVCFTTYGTFTATQFSSTDATAVQNAVNAAADGDMIKIAGTCTGVQAVDGLTQTVYISKSVGLQGGYSEADWTAAPDPETYPTTLDADGLGRVIVVAGNANALVADLIVTGGNAIDGTLSNDGGGLVNDGADVLIVDAYFTGNAAADSGGGIANRSGEMEIRSSVITDNVAVLPADLRDGMETLAPQNFASAGGGIFNYYGNIEIENSTIANNRVFGTGGGGVAHTGETSNAIIRGSTIVNNSASGGKGGGILFSQPITVVNSTISGNSADSAGGIGNDESSADMYITFSTIASNTAALNGNNILFSRAPIFLSNSLIVGDGDNCTSDEFSIFYDEGYNLESGNSCGFTQTTSITNTNPLVLPLENYGGETETHALPGDSPAVDQIPNGTNGCNTEVTTDQRGVTRPIDSSCDMGAFETEAAASCLVEFADDGDTVTDFYGGGRVLQEAIDAAETGDTLHVHGTCYDDTTMVNGLTQMGYISKSLTIIGGYSELWVYDPESYPTLVGSDGSGRVFYITGDIEVTLDSLSLEDGYVDGQGGGIYNSGAALTLNNVALQYNRTNALTGLSDGAGLYNDGGRLTIIDSTIANNQTNGSPIFNYDSGDGGGIYTSGPTTISDSIISDNRINSPTTNPSGDASNSGSGGGIYATAALTLTDSVVSDNTIGSGGNGPNTPFAGNDGGASGDGGGIYAADSLVLTGSEVIRNNIERGGNGSDASGPVDPYAGGAGGNTGSGGGIYSVGDLTIENSTVATNTVAAGGSGGSGDNGGANGADGQDGHGAGIAAFGTVSIMGGEIAGNEAAGDGSYGGGLALEQDGLLMGVVIGENSAAYGGGISVVSAELTNTGGNVTDNSAYQGGGLYLSQAEYSATATTINNNQSTDHGGGLYVDQSTLELDMVTVDNNTASVENARIGGGIFSTNHSTMTIENSDITNNLANVGGGLSMSSNDVVTITNSLIDGNAADHVDVFNRAPDNNYGGGIYNDGGTLAIDSSTISNNTVSGTGGGGLADNPIGVIGATTVISNSTFVNNEAGTGSGGGILSSSDALTMTNTTISDNSASTGGGFYLNNGSSIRNSAVIIQYSTIASNSASINGDNLTVSGQGMVVTTTAALIGGGSSNCYVLNDGTLIDGGYNLDSGASCGFTQTTSLTDTNPLVEPLMDNGGDTETHALDSLSPAVNHIPDGAAGCGSTITADQRGVERPQLDDCDIGAYEYDGERYMLTVNTAGAGSGTITDSGGEIDCGNDCEGSYLENTTVTLTATADANSEFVGWGSVCVGTGSCEVTMDMAQEITATFDLQEYLLTVALAGDGDGTVTSSAAGIECGSDCSELYTYGTEVTLNAAATAGSVFSGWSGACTGTAACVVTVEMAEQVTATFTLSAEPTYLLTVSKDGNGSGAVSSVPMGISCGASCTAAYVEDTEVTLTATADVGSFFSGWSGACTGSGDCTVTMDMAQNVIATFTLDGTTPTYSLTVTNLNGELGSVTSNPAGIDCGETCSAEFAENTVVTLTATAVSEASFSGWGGACSGTAACVVTMDMAQTVTAAFEPDATGLSVYLPLVTR